ncbi:hypothetical protein M440DRAFT_274257 [Trichoderma longibrachiatum ATCC 18648]|uniref:Uncharacterized protein n=1 Tax=Trichoderma longibrachiatum ATCC 18648 TaxID=983965 RepID=A0A2T4C6K5_TRILO|nr:hypothetical protein M440DRAFT_274257 [Trichoderma longibrachiatum ATCC 18648]
MAARSRSTRQRLHLAFAQVGRERLADRQRRGTTKQKQRPNRDKDSLARRRREKGQTKRQVGKPVEKKVRQARPPPSHKILSPQVSLPVLFVCVCVSLSSFTVLRPQPVAEP